MPTSDTIADMLTRIRNANSVGLKRVFVKRSKVCEGIARVLKDEGYITDFAVIEDTNQGEIRIDLKVGDRGELIMQTIDRASKPGRRLYRGWQNLPRVLEVMTRFEVEEDSDFAMLPGFRNFDRVEKDQALATDRRGTIRAEASGWLLFPRYQAQGNDGFFLAREL